MSGAIRRLVALPATSQPDLAYIGPRQTSSFGQPSCISAFQNDTFNNRPQDSDVKRITIGSVP
jgi:hypothetical protein